MKLNPNDIRTYPTFSSYVKNKIPDLVHVNSIIIAIKKFAGTTSRGTILQGLMWSNLPTIKVVPNLLGSGGNPAYGKYIWGGSEIQIDQALVQAYEAGTDKRATLSGLMTCYWGYVVT